MSEVCSELNARYAGQGLLVHMLDPLNKGVTIHNHTLHLNGREEWWLPHEERWFPHQDDRLSASLIQAQMPADPDGSLPIYQPAFFHPSVGVALRHSPNMIRCSVPLDQGTGKADCTPGCDDGPCQPGCMTRMENGDGCRVLRLCTEPWVPEGTLQDFAHWNRHRDRRSDHVLRSADGRTYPACVWGPDDLNPMLQEWRLRRAARFYLCPKRWTDAGCRLQICGSNPGLSASISATHTFAPSRQPTTSMRW